MHERPQFFLIPYGKKVSILANKDQRRSVILRSLKRIYNNPTVKRKSTK